MYKRNEVAGATGATSELWLVDLNTCANSTCPAADIINVVANTTSQLAGHINWSPDGLDIAFSDPDMADYWMARNIVNSDGTINQAFTMQELGPFVPMTADYCVFPPDWPTSTILACVAGPQSSLNAKVFLSAVNGRRGNDETACIFRCAGPGEHRHTDAALRARRYAYSLQQR